MQVIEPDNAPRQVIERYYTLFGAVRDLVHALNRIEPGGTLVDKVRFMTSDDKTVRIAYVATPIHMTIETPERTFIFKVIEHGNGETLVASADKQQTRRRRTHRG